MVTGVSKEVLENIDSPAQFMALTTASGTISVNANITAAGMAGFAANAINITGAALTATNGAWLFASGGAATLSGSSISSTNGFLGINGASVAVSNSTLNGTYGVGILGGIGATTIGSSSLAASQGWVDVSGNTVSITNSQLSAAHGIGVGSHGADGSCEITGTCAFWGFFESSSSSSYGGRVGSGTTALTVPPYNPVHSLDISGSTLTASNGWLDVASAGNMVINSSTLSSPSPSTTFTYLDPMTSQTVTNTYSNGTFLGAQGNMALTNTSVSAGADVWLAAVGDIRLNNGSSAVAGTDVSVTLGSATSTLYINETAGLAASRVWAKSPSTIFLDFYARSTGGVVIDGVPGTTTTVGGSGLFVGAAPVPASPGSGLQVAYFAPAPAPASAPASAIDPCVTNPNQCTLTDPTEPPIEPAPLSFQITGPGGTQSGDLGSTVGGTEGSFGGEEGSKDEKDEKAKKDKKSDEAKDERKDEKRDQKKVAQCT